MKDLVTFINDKINESANSDEFVYANESANSDEFVYAVKDNTDAILNVFPIEQDAKDDLKNWPKEAEVKVEKMKRSEIEDIKKS